MIQHDSNWVSPHFDSCSMLQPYVGVIYATQNVFPRYFTGILCLLELLFHVDDAKTKAFPHARRQRTGRPHLSLLTSSTNLTLSSVSWFLCLDLQIGMANKSNVTDLLFLRTGPIPINVWIVKTWIGQWKLAMFKHVQMDPKLASVGGVLPIVCRGIKAVLQQRMKGNSQPFLVNDQVKLNKLNKL